MTIGYADWKFKLVTKVSIKTKFGVIFCLKFFSRTDDKDLKRNHAVRVP